ncbi:NAD(P)/FAD-dependent oxidoreductase [Vibrio maritimus]
MSSYGKQLTPKERLAECLLWDVIIVGSGPASSSAAIVLAEKGWSVLILEKQRSKRQCYGESLPPAAVSLVQMLLGGIRQEDYPRFGMKATPGNQASWVDEYIDTYDFMSQPAGHGLCVDRQLFDRALQERANKLGACTFTGACFLECEQMPCAPIFNKVTAKLSLGNNVSETHTLQSKFVLDATGRHAAVAKSLGVSTFRNDKLHAFIRYYRSSIHTTSSDFTLLEATETGWWYSNLMPDGYTRVVVFHTDRDLPTAKLARRQSGFVELLGQTEHIKQRLEVGSYSPISDIKSTAANSQVASEFVKGNVLFLGDAAMAFDPLSSQGMTKAIQNGNQAGQLVAFALEDSEAQSAKTQSRPAVGYLQRFELAQKKRWQQYQAQYQHYYSQQRRWRNSEFWSRRHEVMTTAITTEG